MGFAANRIFSTDDAKAMAIRLCQGSFQYTTAYIAQTVDSFEEDA